MALWALLSILAGIVLVGASERIAARLHEPRDLPIDRFAPLTYRLTVTVAGAFLIALGFAGL